MHHNHQFVKIAERFMCWDIGLTDDSPGGLIEKLQSVMPERIPDNEILCYRWLPPRRDPQSGQPMEVKRLQVFRVPIGKDGPAYATITTAIDRMQAPPDSVKMPEKLEIPPEVRAMDEDTLDTLAPQVGLTFPKGAEIQLKRVLMARECNSSPRGKLIMDRIKRAIVGVAKPSQPQEQQPGRAQLLKAGA